MQKGFDTLSEAMTYLKSQGYVEDMRLQEHCLACPDRELEILANEFEVDQVYRFEGFSNPDDSSVLYAISSEKYKLKGLLVDAYGAYSGSISQELIEKLRYDPS